MTPQPANSQPNNSFQINPANIGATLSAGSSLISNVQKFQSPVSAQPAQNNSSQIQFTIDPSKIGAALTTGAAIMGNVNTLAANQPMIPKRPSANNL
jgi:hypothetical protein